MLSTADTVTFYIKRETTTQQCSNISEQLITQNHHKSFERLALFTLLALILTDENLVS